MIRYSLAFLFIAVLAAVLGFGLTALAFAVVAKVLFFLLLVGFLITMVMRMARRV